MAEFRVVVPTNCFAQSCRFYAELPAWRITKMFDGGRIYGAGGSPRIELLDTPDLQPQPHVFLSIEVPDVRTYHDAVVAAGVVLSQPLTKQPWGHLNFAVTDPNGLKLVFFQELA